MRIPAPENSESSPYNDGSGGSKAAESKTSPELFLMLLDESRGEEEEEGIGFEANVEDEESWREEAAEVPPFSSKVMMMTRGFTKLFKL